MDRLFKDDQLHVLFFSALTLPRCIVGALIRGRNYFTLWDKGKDDWSIV